MKLDDLRLFLDALRISDEDRSIIWDAAIRHGQDEYARGHSHGFSSGYSEATWAYESDWP